MAKRGRKKKKTTKKKTTKKTTEEQNVEQIKEDDKQILQEQLDNLKKYGQLNGKPPRIEEDLQRCPKCSSSNLKTYHTTKHPFRVTIVEGVRYKGCRVQRVRCRDCNLKFVRTTPLE